MPKQISLDLDDEDQTNQTIPPARTQHLIALMAEAIVAVWRLSPMTVSCSACQFYIVVPALFQKN